MKVPILVSEGERFAAPLLIAAQSLLSPQSSHITRLEIPSQSIYAVGR
jgi:hypothetical protein